MKTLIHGDFKLVCNEQARLGKIIRLKDKSYVSYFFEIKGDIYFTHIENLPVDISEAFRVELMRGFKSKYLTNGARASKAIPIHRTIIT